MNSHVLFMISRLNFSGQMCQSTTPQVLNFHLQSKCYVSLCRDWYTINHDTLLNFCWKARPVHNDYLSPQMKQVLGVSFSSHTLDLWMLLPGPLSELEALTSCSQMCSGHNCLDFLKFEHSTSIAFQTLGGLRSQDWGHRLKPRWPHVTSIRATSGRQG